MTLTPADRELLREAAATLDVESAVLLHGYATPPEYRDWGIYHAEQQEYDKMKFLVSKLYALAERGELLSAVTP